jgi:hypothetical protein
MSGDSHFKYSKLHAISMLIIREHYFEILDIPDSVQNVNKFLIIKLEKEIENSFVPRFIVNQDNYLMVMDGLVN